MRPCQSPRAEGRICEAKATFRRRQGAVDYGDMLNREIRRTRPCPPPVRLSAPPARAAVNGLYFNAVGDPFAWGASMKRESADYFRARERDERKAARNAACDKARRAHDQMANAYARLLELDEL